MMDQVVWFRWSGLVSLNFELVNQSKPWFIQTLARQQSGTSPDGARVPAARLRRPALVHVKCDEGLLQPRAPVPPLRLQPGRRQARTQGTVSLGSVGGHVVEALSSNLKLYYYHEATHETRWEPPMTA